LAIFYLHFWRLFADLTGKMSRN